MSPTHREMAMLSFSINTSWGLSFKYYSLFRLIFDWKASESSKVSFSSFFYSLIYMIGRASSHLLYTHREYIYEESIVLENAFHHRGRD